MAISDRIAVMNKGVIEQTWSSGRSLLPAGFGLRRALHRSIKSDGGNRDGRRAGPHGVDHRRPIS